MHSVMLSVFKKGYEDLNGADTKSRTRDLLITSQLLYQLSYVGIFNLFFLNLNHIPKVVITADRGRK